MYYFFLNITFMKVLLCLYATAGCVHHIIYWYFCGAITYLCCGNILNQTNIDFTNLGISLVRQIVNLSLVILTNLTSTSLKHDR